MSILIGQIFQILVDYTLSFPELIALGNYDDVSELITYEVNFPTEVGKISQSAELIHFGRRISSDDAITEVTQVKPGYRHANIWELLSFGAEYPELQREFAIVALGTTWITARCLAVSLLSRGEHSERRVGIAHFSGTWGSNIRFLVVRNN